MSNVKSNTGIWNTGDRNTGNLNAGYANAGDCNTGYRNTGRFNIGNLNAGDCNTGSNNTGRNNTGYRNTGNWNTGNWNTGDCNTVTPDNILVFNRPCLRADWDNVKKPAWMYAGVSRWVCTNDMTEKEKQAYPSYVTTGGFLKVFTNPHHAYIDAWEKASKEDRALTLKLPNFDVEVFKEIFGFDPREDKRTIVIDGKKIEISEKSYQLLKRSLTE